MLKFSDKEALDNCLLFSKPLGKTFQKIFFDWLTLSYEADTCNKRWAN